MSYILLISLVTIAFILSTTTNSVTACPRMQCAPIISKCQLIDACRCEAKLNYTCYKACSHCLGDLYSECCSCVGKLHDDISYRVSTVSVTLCALY